MRRDYCWAVRAIFMASVMQLLASYVTAVPMSNYNEHQAGVGGEQEIVTARHQYATVARAIDAYAYGDGARADAVQLERVRHLLHDGHLALTSVDYGRLALRAMLGARWPDAFNAVVEVSVEATTTPFNEVVRSIAIDPVRYHAVGERFYSRLRRKLHLGVTGHVARPDLTDFLHQHALLLDFVDPRNGRTALVEAMLRGDVVMARALLAAGADPVKGIVCRGTRASRTSPLHLAAMRPLLTGLIPDLVEAGTPVDAVDVDGRTAMYWAVATFNSAAVEILLRYGASPRRASIVDEMDDRNSDEEETSSSASRSKTVLRRAAVPMRCLRRGLGALCLGKPNAEIASRD